MNGADKGRRVQQPGSGGKPNTVSCCWGLHGALDHAYDQPHSPSLIAPLSSLPLQYLQLTLHEHKLSQHVNTRDVHLVGAEVEGRVPRRSVGINNGGLAA